MTPPTGREITLSLRYRMIAPAAVLGLVAALGVPAITAGPALAQSGQSTTFPGTIPLPDGFAPEGIAIGSGPTAYFGSLADGSIFEVNLATGAGEIISEGPGTSSVGLALDRRGRLFVAGGGTGDARVVSVTTGEVLASYQFATGTTFINDVTLTRDGAWFTDSFNPVLYRLPLGAGGALPAADGFEVVSLTGDFQQVPGFNANGITGTPDRAGLLVVQSATGSLFRVDPATGAATEVDLAGESLAAADGMLLHGRTLYVVQNQLNQVAAVRLDPTSANGTVVDRVTDPRFDVPTTVARFGGRLYLPNARFGVPPTPTTPYDAVAIRRF